MVLTSSPLYDMSTLLLDKLRRHPEMECRLTRGSTVRYLTTERPEPFSDNATLFLGHIVEAEHIAL